MSRLDPDAPTERLELDDGAWVDVIRGYVADADDLFDHLREQAAWRQSTLFRYEKRIAEPRLGAGARRGDPAVPDIVWDAQRDLQRRYRARFDAPALAWYRDGRDSVAFHRDTDMRWLDDTVIAIVSLGATRPFQLRPRTHRHAHHLPDRGATHDLRPASGDLLVMGGGCQARWEHAVPKVAGAASRISIQWRWTSRHGRPQQGPGYRAPLHFSRGT